MKKLKTDLKAILKALNGLVQKLEKWQNNLILKAWGQTPILD